MASEVKQRFGTDWHSVLQRLADSAAKEHEESREFVPSVADVWRLLCSLGTKTRLKPTTSTLENYMYCYHYPDMHLGRINSVLYRLWPSIRCLKEHDTTEVVAGDTRPFIPWNVFGIYESLKSRLHVGLRSDSIGTDGNTQQSKLSRFSARSKPRSKVFNPAASATPMRIHQAKFSNGSVHFEESAPLLQLSGEAGVIFPQLFVNLGPVEFFNEKA